MEFACETMENVAKELYELIDQYRADPKRNINPFSMRLQGIIDANVMGSFSIFMTSFHFSTEFPQHALLKYLFFLIFSQNQVALVNIKRLSSPKIFVNRLKENRSK